ncbi:Uncharacterized protein SCF082_LOCUS20885 [Durusdinium trenchii]|uniref:Uncharacterized protein n=1 Tax=Durusdinium trenchii TaxID=1381693 RepID=A0ABP0L835_9DINO
MSLGLELQADQSGDRYDEVVLAANMQCDPQSTPLLKDQLEQQMAAVAAASQRLARLEERLEENTRRQPELCAAKDGETLIQRVTRLVEGHLKDQDDPYDQGRTPSEPVRLPFERILELMLKSLRGRFESSVSRQKCASPVPFCQNKGGYVPLFYVSKDRRLVNGESGAFDIPVRYQGFNKAKVWFSPKTPEWGIIARRMQHQARMKRKQSAALGTKAALFFNVFEGFSYVLIKRPNFVDFDDNSLLAKHIVEEAAKIVQIWPVPQSTRRVPPSIMDEEDSKLPSGELYPDEVLSVARKRQQRDSHSCLDPSGPEQPSMVHHAGPTRNDFTHHFDDLDGNDFALAADTDMLDTGSKNRDSTLSWVSNNKSQVFDRRAKAALQQDSRAVVNETQDPTGLALAHHMFQTTTNLLDKAQCSREFEKLTKVFSPEIAAALRAAVDRRDPRIQTPFLFPLCETFVEGVPIASIISTASTGDGSDQVVTASNSVARAILRFDPTGIENLFDDHLESSSIAFLVSRFVQARQSILPGWFHRIVSLGDGTRAVFRGLVHCEYGPNGKLSMETRFQDVSFLFQDLLNMHPLP